MSDRALSARDLNRALLARQLLLERSALSLPDALEQVAGIQAQYAPSAYVGLWSRLRGFERGALTRALEERRVVQATLMRTTIHVVSARDYWPMAAGIRRERREWWLRVTRRQMGMAEMKAAAKVVRAALTDGPRRQTELQAAIQAAGLPRITWPGVATWLDMVRVPPSGTWERRRADLYALAEDWIPPSATTEEEGTELLVRRYLTGFGPASWADVGSWAGLSVAALRRASRRLEMRSLRDEQGRELVDLPDLPLPAATAPAPLRFLPTWDATLLVHARRTQLLPEKYRPLVFNTKTPHSVPTFLVDGQVAGTWRYEEGRVQLSPFVPLSRPAERELDAEAEGLAAFHAQGSGS